VIESVVVEEVDDESLSQVGVCLEKVGCESEGSLWSGGEGSLLGETGIE
jgi:hypothetical protein